MRNPDVDTKHHNRILARNLAVEFDYQEFFKDADSARRGEVDLISIGTKSTCTGSGGSDEDED